MAYEIGSYLKELRTEHQRGDHRNGGGINCPVCAFSEVPEGFFSRQEFHKAVLGFEAHLDARGHGKTPQDGCTECANKGIPSVLKKAP